MNWLVTTDLHLSDRARDSYRFGLFPWLFQQQEKYDVDATFILGDLTENKDRHSSTLVNRIVEELIDLEPPIFILRGNHDGINPNSPFFKFLSSIDGITFITSPTYFALDDKWVALVPHCQTQDRLDAACKIMPKPEVVFLHNTFEGARAETGTVLSGLSVAPVAALKPRLGAYSGDVHVPQSHGAVTYVGAPYHVRFGDHFTPRVLLIRDGKPTDLHFNAPRKFSLQIGDADDILNNEGLSTGDQVKITVMLAREEAVEWHAHKNRVLAACRERGLDVFGIDCEVRAGKRDRVRLKDETRSNSPQDILEAFCKAEKVAANIKQAGLDLCSTSSA